MIVCHCAVVTDHEIRAAVDDGATDICSLAETCGTSRACGGCLPAIRSELATRGLPTDESLEARDVRAILRARRRLSPSVEVAS